MKIKYGILLALLLVACIVAPASAAGGSGTASDPYRIQTAAELQSINNNLGAYYILMNDIDLSGVTWTPIGTSSVGFHGSFDGNGKVIKNLALSSTSSNVGFFGGVTSGATIKDITFQDCSVTGGAQCGIVIGAISMSSSAHETAVLSNIDCVRCSVTVSRTSTGCLVGLIGTSAVVKITDCDVSYSVSESTGSSAVGCFVGTCDIMPSIEITRCNVLYSHVRAHGDHIGGFVGKCLDASSLVVDSSTVQNSIVESTTNGGAAGCLVGMCYGGSSVNSLNCDVTNCLVKGASLLGGLYGVNYGDSLTASDCTVTGCTIVGTGNYVGGIAGRITSGKVGAFSDCTVTDSTIIASGYAAGVCPAYS